MDIDETFVGALRSHKFDSHRAAHLIDKIRSKTKEKGIQRPRRDTRQWLDVSLSTHVERCEHRERRGESGGRGKEDRREFFHKRRKRVAGTFLYFHRTGEFSSVRGGLGTRRVGRGGMSQSAWPAQSFRQTRAENSREGKADIPKQTEHSAERACRRNLFLPFQTERNITLLWLSFQETAPSDHCTLSTFRTFRPARD